MAGQQFVVQVVAEESVVRGRLNEVAENPQEVVRWFTSDRGVTATVTADGDIWFVEVEGGAFRASGTVELRSREPGSLITVDLDLKGQGVFAFASPMLAVAGGKIEGTVRSALQREFGSP